MLRLYRKSEIWFAICCIIIYVVGSSAAEEISRIILVPKLITFLFHLLFCIVLFCFLMKNNLYKNFGICRPCLPAARLLYYIPLIVLISTNLWFGVRFNFSTVETLFYIGSMLCVGVLEEIIFRGFLYKAMEKDSPKAAILVSSITFGLGHIINLINGSGMGLVENLCQIVSAITVGFLFVIIFKYSKSLIPCIVTHSAINSLSAFSNDAYINSGLRICLSGFICLCALTYSYYIKNMNKVNK